MLCRHPLDRSLDLAVRRSAAAPRIRIVGAAEFRDLARCILDDLITFNNIGMLEADLAARLQAEELLRCVLHEILAVDIELTAEGHITLPAVRRTVFCQKIFRLALRIVREDKFQRAQHCHNTRCIAVEFVAHAVFEHGTVHRAVALCYADLFAECAHGRRRIAAPSHP